MMLHSVNINFNGFQIFDAWISYAFYHKSYNQSEIMCKKNFELQKIFETNLQK